MDLITINSNNIYATTQIYSLNGYHFFNSSFGMFLNSLFTDEYQLPQLNSSINIVNKSIYGKLLSADGKIELVAQNIYDNARLTSYLKYDVLIDEIAYDAVSDIIDTIKDVNRYLKKAECILGIDPSLLSYSKYNSLKTDLANTSSKISNKLLTITQPNGSLVGIPIEPLTFLYSKHMIGSLSFSLLEPV